MGHRIWGAAGISLLIAFGWTSCSGGYPRVPFRESPQIVNVSEFDPKERQRPGDSYTTDDVSALRHNGALGLIARVGKGTHQDRKFARFLAAANRQGMLLGSYYFVLKNVDPVWQADRYVERLRQVGPAQAPGKPILLVGDFDSRSQPRDLVRFIDRIESRTGVLPVIYLENSAHLRRVLSSATPAEKARIRQCPYWLALYSHTDFATPGDLLRSYDIWDDWAMWQYGGVEWSRPLRRSLPKHYSSGQWRTPAYFGTMDRPLERNAFNGSVMELSRFWARHSWIPR